MIQTLAFNARLPVLLGASPFYRTPDAPIARGLELTERDYVRARLTAMAIETEGFSRDEIYTLFVTTRIINFLKGLPLSSSTDLETLIKQRSFAGRTEIGFELLRNLAESGRMYFWTKRGLIENRRFRADVFRRVISQAANRNLSEWQGNRCWTILCLSSQSGDTGRRREMDNSHARPKDSSRSLHSFEKPPIQLRYNSGRKKWE